MPKYIGGDDSPVDGEDVPWLSDVALERPNKRHQPPLKPALYLIVYTLSAFSLLFGGVVIGNRLDAISYLHNRVRGDSMLDLFSEISFDRQPKRFNGSFFNRSLYSGPPNSEMDELWSRYADTGSTWMPTYPAVLNVSLADAKKSTNVPIDTAVQLDDTDRQGYMASLEVFHQLHCLNYLRRFIYLEYYQETDPRWANNLLLREHADHCVDMLLQTLSCRSDTNLILYHWVEGHTIPMPNFSTMHSCRDPEAILEWTRENEVHLTHNVVKQEGDKGLPEIF